MRWYLDASVALHVVLPWGDQRARAWFETVAGADEDPFSSDLLELEVIRALRRERLELSLARQLIARVNLISLDQGVLRTAGGIEAHVKTLDAIHLATASLLGFDVTMVTHDVGMRRAAGDLGFDTVDPVGAT